MFNLPDRYKTDVKVALKDFIPKDLKPNDKKRIKDAVKEVRLVYQIAGEEIPSVVDANYRCQAIQFFDIEVVDIKDAQFLASTYQNIIKPYCLFSNSLIKSPGTLPSLSSSQTLLYKLYFD